MDAVFQKIAENTGKFNLGDEEEWREVYEPFYPEQPDNVVVVRDQRYGPGDRHLVDVYHPRDDSSSSKPVLLFMHGGGFFSGDKWWSEKCWGNIGNFFSQQGIVVVIANHQLVYYESYKTKSGDNPGKLDVHYPAGADDIQLVREWIYENIASSQYGQGSPNKVVLFGHSSGGAHIAMNLYAAGDPGRSAGKDVFPPVAGVIYLSVPFWYDSQRPIRKKILQRYYGSDSEERWGPRSVLGLFKRLPEDAAILNANDYPTYIGTVKWEVTEAIDGALAFFKAYVEKSKPDRTLPLFHVLDKHNHLTNVLSIGTEDTTQGTELLKFIQSCVRKTDKVDQNLKGGNSVVLTKSYL